MNEAKEIERFTERYGSIPLGKDTREQVQWERAKEVCLWRARLDRTEILIHVCRTALLSVNLGLFTEAKEILELAIAEHEALAKQEDTK